MNFPNLAIININSNILLSNDDLKIVYHVVFGFGSTFERM